MATRPVKLGPFRGMNNRLPDTGLRTKEGDFLLSAVNADVMLRGKLKMRPGYASAQAGSACHSLWGDGGTFGYYVDGQTLYRVRRGPGGTLSRQSVRADLTAGLLLSYARVGDAVYYSNGIERGIVRDASAQSNWGDLPDFTDTESPAYLCRPMPAGRIVRYYKGRLLVARGPTLYLSEAYAPNIYRPARGYIPFLADITLVVPMDTGFFVAADRTYWLPGDPLDTSPIGVLPYGALRGSDTPIPNKEAALWMTPRGLVRGAADGSVTNLQEDTVATDTGASAATLVRELDGMKKAVSAIAGVDATNMAAASFMSAEIVRKGIEL